MTQGTALITGASSGIGAVYAEKLARRGFDLLIVARDTDRLASLAARLSKEQGVTVTPMHADLLKPEGLKQVQDKIWGDTSLRMLVQCAGIGPSGSVLGTGVTGLSDMVYLNVDVLHVLTVTAAKVFASRGTGAIVNIASVVALMPEQFNASYVASKAFVLALTQALAIELQPLGVRIQAVLPGFTRTEIFERAGIDITEIPPDMMMDASEMVEAALAGFDQGEVVTIPSLADDSLWRKYGQARGDLAPHLSLKHAAGRYANGVNP